jgi:two-component system chemotaxis response regulator CheY
MMSPKKVLIVDDSESMRQIVARVLDTLGVRVFESPCAKEGMTILLQESVDLLITDWNMLEMDGLELTRVLRSMSAYEHLPILMLSNNDSDTSRVEALLAGVDTFVSKCSPFDVLRREVVNLLHGDRRREEWRRRQTATPKSVPGATSALLLGFPDRDTKALKVDLARLGYRGFTARDPWEALSCLQQIAGLELLVVEWSQLRPDYLNMVLQIQQDSRWKNIRVLVLNAPWVPPGPADGARPDAHAFLRTGCSVDELRSALRSMGLRPKEEGAKKN